MDEQNDRKTDKAEDVLARLRDSSPKWVPSVSGGVVSAAATFLIVILPLVNTWLANAKEVSLAQLQVAKEQMDYKDQRRLDSEKERDLYREQMNLGIIELRKLNQKLNKCSCPDEKNN